jgi:hypothetical protein
VTSHDGRDSDPVAGRQNRRPGAVTPVTSAGRGDRDLSPRDRNRSPGNENLSPHDRTLSPRDRDDRPTQQSDQPGYGSAQGEASALPRSEPAPLDSPNAGLADPPNKEAESQPHPRPLSVKVTLVVVHGATADELMKRQAAAVRETLQWFVDHPKKLVVVVLTLHRAMKGMT